ncbi:DEAD/DEAH box helicase family protein [Candidatus Peregrinibacteria bacterium]|jgi:superfamily II DNA or RNA helicase|nr:DEAD/DEAH box helicase family protein [Candidatus Peregrinibacteria bacterium]MBT4055954.1 DEAD/DEAH box helicase family protein [Candidatus Peregrinibacteria bacterium]
MAVGAEEIRYDETTDDLDQSTDQPESPKTAFELSLVNVKRGELMEGLEDRPYQVEATDKILDQMITGTKSGDLIVGAGGGKTAIAVNIMAQAKGKTLWLAPTTVAIRRIQEELERLQVDKKVQKLGGKGDSRSIDPSAEIVITTWQMLISQAKFKKIPQDYFDLCVFDESHRFNGVLVRQLEEWFKSYQLHMTATKVGNEDRTVFSRYGAEKLIDNDGYPPWIYHRYEVDNEKLNEVTAIGGRYAIENGKEDRHLDMPKRYAICLDILRKTVVAGEKTIAFMPSVPTSKNFVNEFAKKDPILQEYADKIVHVDGTMSTDEILEIEERFKLPPDHPNAILAVCGNDIWTESLDVPDIKHVILADPCCSRRVFIQRIGRGARPAKDKDCLHIHDVVSTINRVNKKYVTGGKKPLTVAGIMGIKHYANGVVLIGKKKGLVWDDRDEDGNKGPLVIPRVMMESIHFTEREVDLNFLQDKECSLQVMEMFAELLGTNIFNLGMSPDLFLARQEELIVRSIDGGATHRISFREFMEVLEFFNVKDIVMRRVMKSIEAISEDIRRQVVKAETRAQLRDPNITHMKKLQILRNEAWLLSDLAGNAPWLNPEKNPEDEEFINEIGRVIPDDPFDESRLDTFVCPDKEMMELWRIIFAEINKSDNQEELTLDWETLRNQVSSVIIGDIVESAVSPGSIDTIRNIEEIGLMNNIEVRCSQTGLSVSTKWARNQWVSNFNYQRSAIAIYEVSKQGKTIFYPVTLLALEPEVNGVIFDESVTEHLDLGTSGCEEPELSQTTMRLVKEVIAADREYILIDPPAIKDVFALMGIHTKKTIATLSGTYKENQKFIMDSPFIHITQLPDGTWKVPIKHVVIRGKPGRRMNGFTNTNKKGDEARINSTEKRRFRELARKISEVSGKPSTRAVLKILSKAVKTTKIDPDSKERTVKFSIEDATIVIAILKLYNIESEIYPSKSDENIADIQVLKNGHSDAVAISRVEGSLSPEAPKKAKLAKDQKQEIQVSGTIQRHHFKLEEHDKKILKMIFETLLEGKTEFTHSPKTTEELNEFCDAIFNIRLYLKSFGYTGNLLSPTGRVSTTQITLNLHGLKV